MQPSKEAVMKFSLNLFRRSLAAAIAALALAAPAAMADPSDLRSPDAKDAADRPALDARYAPGNAAVSWNDLGYASVAAAPAPEAAHARAAGNAFDWGSAGIGAAVAGGIALVAFGAAYRVRLRPAR
jgi:hypothetical protein